MFSLDGWNQLLNKAQPHLLAKQNIFKVFNVAYCRAFMHLHAMISFTVCYPNIPHFR